MWQTRCCSLPLMRHPISKRPKSSSTAVQQGHHLALPFIVNRHTVRGRRATSTTGGKTDPPVNTTHRYSSWAVLQGESSSVKMGRKEEHEYEFVRANGDPRRLSAAPRRSWPPEPAVETKYSTRSMHMARCLRAHCASAAKSGRSRSSRSSPAC